MDNYVSGPKRHKGSGNTRPHTARRVPVTLARLSSKRLLRLGDKLVASSADPATVVEFLRVATRRLQRDGFLVAPVAS